MSDIKITIGADIKELEQKLSVAKTKVEGFDKSSTAAAGSFRKFGDVLPDVGKKAANMGDGLRGAADAAQQAGGELGDMAGILQGGLIALIPVAVAGLKALYDALFGVSEEQKAFNDTLNDASKSFTSAYTSISELRIQAELLNKGVGDADSFLKQYNETLGKTVGETDNLKTAEENLVNFGDKYIKLMYLKSIANSAFARSGQLVLESLALQQQGDDIPAEAVRRRLKELQSQIDIFKNLGENATKLISVLNNDIPKKVGAALQGVLLGENNKAEIQIQLKPKFVKPKKQDADDFRYKYNYYLGQLFTSENTKTDELEPKIIIKPKVEFVLPELDKRVTELNAMVSDIFANGLSNLAENIGKALTGKGGIGDIFSGLFKSLGAGLKQLGQYFIKTGIEVKLFKEFITKNPILAILAGFALTALGSVIESATSKKAAFATGTRNFSGGSALVGERGPELLTLPAGASITPNAQLNAMGGREIFIAETVIRGTDLVTVYNRATQLNSRNS